jgi:hypothetical protein
VAFEDQGATPMAPKSAIVGRIRWLADRRSPGPSRRRPPGLSGSRGGSTRVCTGASVGVCTRRAASRLSIPLRSEGVIEPDIPINASKLLSVRVSGASNWYLPDRRDGGWWRRRALLIGLPPRFPQIASRFDSLEMRATPARFAAWVTVLARLNAAIAMRVALGCRNAARPGAKDDQHRCREAEHTALPCRCFNTRIHDDTPPSMTRIDNIIYRHVVRQKRWHGARAFCNGLVGLLPCIAPV